MTHLKLRQIFLFGFPILLCLVSLAGGASEVTDSYNKSFQVEGRSTLTVKNGDGRTRIVAKEGSMVEVQVTKEVSGAKDMAATKKAADQVAVLLEQVGGRIEISVKYPKKIGNFLGLGPNVLVNFEITAPPTSDVTASMVDGDLEVAGFNGEVRLSGVDGDTTASQLSGEIHISGVDGNIHATGLSGRSEISVVDGDVTSEDCSGQLSIRSVDGKMQLERFQGVLETKSGDGDASLDGVFQSLNVRTSDGDLEIHARQGSAVQENWSIHSSDGNLQISLPNPFPANVDLKASDGKIITTFPIEVSGRISDRSVSGKMNGGGNLLSIETGDGNITISQTSQ